MIKRLIKWMKGIHLCFYHPVDDYGREWQKHKCRCGNVAYRNNAGEWKWFSKEGKQ